MRSVSDNNDDDQTKANHCCNHGDELTLKVSPNMINHITTLNGLHEFCLNFHHNLIKMFNKVMEDKDRKDVDAFDLAEFVLAEMIKNEKEAAYAESREDNE